MSSSQWQADIEIHTELAKQCIESQFPQFKPIENIYQLAEGWDNCVFLVNETWIFRFPRRKVAAPLIERENQLLPVLSQRLTLATFNPIFQGQASKLFPYAFHGYKMLPGEAAYQLTLSHQQRQNSIQPLALFLKQLHSTDRQQAQQLGAKPQVYDRTDASFIVEALWQRFQHINERGFAILNETVFAKEMQIALEIQLDKKHQVLVHGDLYSRHLLFDQGKLSAVIDWGDVGINHPAVDLAVVYSFLPKDLHEIFWQYYGAVDQSTQDYARFLGIHSTLTTLLYGAETDDQPLVEESLYGLGNISPQIL